MTTQEIVKQLKKHNAEFPVSGPLYLTAAERLEALDRALDLAVKERTPHDYGILADQRDEYRRMLSDAIKQVEKERAEVEQLKQALHDARLENSGQAARIEELRAEVELLRQENAMVERTRAEPSRLEIAAMLLGAQPPPQAGLFSGQAEHALRRADALIAAAKEAR